MKGKSKKPGRKSAASLGVVVPVTGEPARPAAPADLTGDQAEIWQAVVQEMPSDWFGGGSLALLTQFCRHVISARKVAALIAEHLKTANLETNAADVQRYNKLLIMQAREGVAITALGRSMRLTPQSRIDPQTAGRRMSAVPKFDPPWEPPKPPHLM